MNSDRRLVQTIINSLDIEKARETAAMAVKFGSDQIGAGTSLLYSGGLVRVLPALKKIAGDIPVVADIKVHDGGGYFPVEAQKYGADFCTVSTRMNYGCCRQAAQAHLLYGVTIIGDLCTVPENEIPHYVVELQNIGLQSVCVHLTADEARYYGRFRQAWDCVRTAKSVAKIPVGCVVRSFEDIRRALDEGSDWVAISGEMADNGAENGYADLKAAIEMVHDYHNHSAAQ